MVHYRSAVERSLNQQMSTSLPRLSSFCGVCSEKTEEFRSSSWWPQPHGSRTSQLPNQGAFSHEIGGKRLCFAWCGSFNPVYIYSFALHLLYAAARSLLESMRAGTCSLKLLLLLNFSLGELVMLVWGRGYLDLVNNDLEMEKKKAQPN